MNAVVEKLLNTYRQLEVELEAELEARRRKFHYRVLRKRVEFEAAVKRKHREMRIGIFRFISQSSILTIITAPVIYALIFPLVILDITVSLYQWICFPVYGIRKVPRDDFIVVDRHHLAYLNPIEKLNCAYCGYANGLLAYTREIAGRTEEHWCPIKHARKIKGLHAGYYRFSDYGDAETYQRNHPDGKDEK